MAAGGDGRVESSLLLISRLLANRMYPSASSRPSVSHPEGIRGVGILVSQGDPAGLSRREKRSFPPAGTTPDPSGKGELPRAVGPSVSICRSVGAGRDSSDPGAKGGASGGTEIGSGVGSG